jgi:hypothetical protein
MGAEKNLRAVLARSCCWIAATEDEASRRLGTFRVSGERAHRGINLERFSLITRKTEL